MCDHCDETVVLLLRQLELTVHLVEFFDFLA
jgi:hypothetical protein